VFLRESRTSSLDFCLFVAHLCKGLTGVSRLSVKPQERNRQTSCFLAEDSSSTCHFGASAPSRRLGIEVILGRVMLLTKIRPPRLFTQSFQPPASFYCFIHQHRFIQVIPQTRQLTMYASFSNKLRFRKPNLEWNARAWAASGIATTPEVYMSYSIR